MKYLFTLVISFLLLSCGNGNHILESRERVEDINWSWLYLSSWYILQNDLPGDPYAFPSPTELYKSVNDPWTVHLSDEDAAAYRQYFTGGSTYYGIGILLGKRDSIYFIREVFRNSPAERGGLRKYDTIVEVNDIPMIGASEDALVVQLRGANNSQLEILVGRASFGRFPLTITRGVYELPPLITDTINNSIGYIALFGFEDTSTVSVSTSEALETALQETNSYAATIIDLRDNPGGLVSECVKICEMFLDSGDAIINAKERDYNEFTGRFFTKDSVYRSKVTSSYASRKFVFLVDRGSASASEMLVSAVAHNRPDITILGDTTFGKARGQYMFDVAFDGGFFKISVMTIKTPSGFDYNNIGIPPARKLGGNPDYWLDSAYVQARVAAGLAAKTLAFKGTGDSGNSHLEEIRINRKILSRRSPVYPEKGVVSVVRSR